MNPTLKPKIVSLSGEPVQQMEKEPRHGGRSQRILARSGAWTQPAVTLGRSSRFPPRRRSQPALIARSRASSSPRVEGSNRPPLRRLVCAMATSTEASAEEAWRAAMAERRAGGTNSACWQQRPGTILRWGRKLLEIVLEILDGFEKDDRNL